MSTTVKLLGTQVVVKSLEGVGERLLDQRPVFEREMRRLEAAEVGVFGELGGRYVATGRTRNSLTLPEAPDAVRQVTHGSMAFGTKVWYAHFLTEHIGPKTAKGGMARPKPVAVVKLSPATRQQITRDVMNYVTGQSSGALGLGAAVLGGML